MDLLVPVQVPKHDVWWLLNPMTSVGFIDAKCLLLPGSSSGAALVPSLAALVSSGTALVSLKPGTELSLVERGIWKEECFLKEPLEGKFYK